MTSCKHINRSVVWNYDSGEKYVYCQDCNKYFLVCKHGHIVPDISDLTKHKKCNKCNYDYLKGLLEEKL